MTERLETTRDALRRNRRTTCSLLALVVLGGAILALTERGAAQPVAAAERQPVPTPAKLAAAQTEIREIFEKEFAASELPAEKVALSDKLLTTGLRTQDDPHAQYALFVAARELAVEAGQIDPALRATDALSERFVVDAHAERLATLTSCAKSAAVSTAALTSISERTRAAAREAVASSDFDHALAYARLSYDAAQKTKNTTLIKAATELGKSITAQRLEFVAYEAARNTLERAPTDGDANMVVGRWLWFRADEPEQAFPFLAKTAESPLKQAAAAEAEKPSEFAAQIALGDRWWDLAKTVTDETMKDRITARAVEWYRRAAPQATALHKLKVDQRIAAYDAAKKPAAASASDVAKGGKSSPGGKAATGGFPDRVAEARAVRALAEGGTKESEEAVERSLKWIASVQARDGGWNFDTTQTLAGSTQPGDADKARNGATGMALMAFLAAGYTHRNPNPYQGTIQRGLTFLAGNMNSKYSNGTIISWHEPSGTMYSHAIATAAICEALAMTKDRTLSRYAQGGINFIIAAQDPRGGGWRYAPQDQGDTSVFGWQMMALKAGAAAGIAPNAATIAKAREFLDSVSSPTDQRASYGYTGPGKSSATTAIGLLGRIQTGWKKTEPGLGVGIQGMLRTGPSPSNFYANYYATMLLYEWGGDEWPAWNEKLRTQLLSTQTAAGVDAGSWGPVTRDHTSAQGGRLICTCLGCLTLQTYYRYPKVFDKNPAPAKAG